MQRIVGPAVCMPQLAFSIERRSHGTTISIFEMLVLAFVIVQTTIQVFVRTAYTLYVERISRYVAKQIHSGRDLRHCRINACRSEVEVPGHSGQSHFLILL